MRLNEILYLLALTAGVLVIMYIGIEIGKAKNQTRSIACPDTYTLIETDKVWLCARDFVAPDLVDLETGEIIGVYN